MEVSEALHYEVLKLIDDNIEEDEIRKFKIQCRPWITRAKLEKLKYTSEILDQLQTKAVISVGEYTELYKILDKLQLIELKKNMQRLLGQDTRRPEQPSERNNTPTCMSTPVSEESDSGASISYLADNRTLPMDQTQKQLGKETMTSKFHTSIQNTLKSVALIQWGDYGTGTGFRVGEDYIITNHHVVEKEFDLIGDPVKGAAVFNYFETQSQEIGYVPFEELPIKAYSPEDQLDFAVLKLDPTRQLPSLFDKKFRQELHVSKIPPPLTKFSALDIGRFKKITFVGHPKGLHQVVDSQCIVKHPQPSEKGFKEEFDNLKREHGEDIFPYYDDVNRVLYDVSEDFDGGSSGSPGFIQDLNENACVAAVHARAYMMRLTDTHLPPHKDSVEQGIRIEEISHFLEKHHNKLWKDIFCLSPCD